MGPPSRAQAVTETALGSDGDRPALVGAGSGCPPRWGEQLPWSHAPHRGDGEEPSLSSDGQGWPGAGEGLLGTAERLHSRPPQGPGSAFQLPTCPVSRPRGQINLGRTMFILTVHLLTSACWVNGQIYCLTRWALSSRSPLPPASPGGQTLSIHRRCPWPAGLCWGLGRQEGEWVAGSVLPHHGWDTQEATPTLMAQGTPPQARVRPRQGRPEDPEDGSRGQCPHPHWYCPRPVQLPV